MSCLRRKVGCASRFRKISNSDNYNGKELSSGGWTLAVWKSSSHRRFCSYGKPDMWNVMVFITSDHESGGRAMVLKMWAWCEEAEIGLWHVEDARKPASRSQPESRTKSGSGLHKKSCSRAHEPVKNFPKNSPRGWGGLLIDFDYLKGFCGKTETISFPYSNNNRNHKTKKQSKKKKKEKKPHKKQNPEL